MEHTQKGMPFGEVIRARRLEMKLSLTKLSATVGVSKGYMSRVERENLVPGEGTIVALAKALDLNSDVLLAAAGKVASDVMEIVRHNADIAPSALRDASDSQTLGEMLKRWKENEWKHVKNPVIEVPSPEGTPRNPQYHLTKEEVGTADVFLAAYFLGAGFALLRVSSRNGENECRFSNTRAIRDAITDFSSGSFVRADIYASMIEKAQALLSQSPGNAANER